MRATAGTVIERPIEEVFRFTTDIGSWDQWAEGVSAPEPPDEFKTGCTFSSKYTYCGKTHDVTYAVTAFDPPRGHAIKVVSGPFRFEGIMDFESVDGGTQITSSIDTGSDQSATAAKLERFVPLVRITLTNQLRKELATLKACLEQCPA